MVSATGLVTLSLNVTVDTLQAADIAFRLAILYHNQTAGTDQEFVRLYRGYQGGAPVGGFEPSLAGTRVVYIPAALSGQTNLAYLPGIQLVDGAGNYASFATNATSVFTTFSATYLGP